MSLCVCVEDCVIVCVGICVCVCLCVEGCVVVCVCVCLEGCVIVCVGRGVVSVCEYARVRLYARVLTSLLLDHISVVGIGLSSQQIPQAPHLPPDPLEQ